MFDLKIFEHTFEPKDIDVFLSFTGDATAAIYK